MENADSLAPKVNLSFLLGWVLANIVGLPALSLPYDIGYFLLGSLVIIGDGMPIGLTEHAFILIILALSGALLGVWLGVMQSLPLKARMVQSGRWIGVSSLGVAIGAPISWLVYLWFLESPIVDRPGSIYGLYFSFGYAHLIFGVLLGLTIGVPQWSVLQQQFHGAGWWIILLPVCFALDVLFTNFYLANTQVLKFFPVFGPLTALVGVGCITGILLRWLFQFPKT
jgi:hypothetical protein